VVVEPEDGATGATAVKLNGLGQCFMRQCASETRRNVGDIYFLRRQVMKSFRKIHVIVLALMLAQAAAAQTFIDDFTDNAFTQANWTFFNYFGGTGTGLAGGGELKLSASGGADDLNYAIGEIDTPFAADTVIVRGGVKWTEQQLDDRLVKEVFVRGNLAAPSLYFLNFDPGTIGINLFSIRKLVDGEETLIQSQTFATCYEPDVHYNYEFVVSGTSLFGRMWTGDDYLTPLSFVSTIDTDLPPESPYVSVGLFTEILGPSGSSPYCPDIGPNVIPFLGPVTDSVFLGNTTFGDVFSVCAGSAEITPSGSGVVVQPPECASAQTPVTLTFDNVTTGGETIVTTTDTGPPPPSGFRFGSPTTYHDIATTAEFSGSIEVCIDYSGVSFVDESLLSLYHLEAGVWGDVTSSLDTETDTVCGTVTSLSTFAVAEVQFPADCDADGDVDGIDFGVFASCYNKAGNSPRTLGCTPEQGDKLDFDDDGDVDGVDFSAFASCFNKAGNPPRTAGCPQN
jgi:hypothetical protein